MILLYLLVTSIILHIVQAINTRDVKRNWVEVTVFCIIAIIAAYVCYVLGRQIYYIEHQTAFLTSKINLWVILPS